MSAKLPTMDDVFKSHPKPDVMKSLLVSSRTRATQILQEAIPTKILRLQELIAAESDPTSVLFTGAVQTGAYVQPTIFQPTDGAEVDGQKVIMPGSIVCPTNQEGRKHKFEVMPKNTAQEQLIVVVNREVSEMHLLVQDLRVWLELEIPVIEDGNSFGADVQAHMISDLRDVFKRSFVLENGCRAHHTDRIKLAEGWAMAPNIMDYPAAIAASDRFDNLLMRSYLRTLLIIYGGLMTQLEKNWSKVINPKGSGSNSGAMY